MKKKEAGLLSGLKEKIDKAVEVFRPTRTIKRHRKWYGKFNKFKPIHPVTLKGYRTK